MISETETVLDRRRLRRSVTLWRAGAILALALAAGAYLAGGDRIASLTGQKQIARVAIEGTITENRGQLKLLKKIEEASHVAGLIVFVNSPGGTTAGGEALYEALRKVAEKKPVAAQFGTVAASAGYIVGLGTDHIVARGNSITGSVGVIIQWPEVSELLAKLGVKMNEIKSGDLKAVPSPFQPLDEPGRRVTKEMITDSNRWFQSLVELRRGVKVEEVPGLDQGRIYSGRDALKHRLVDEIGGEAEVVRWMEERRGVAKGLKVVDWRTSAERGLGVGAALSEVFGQAIGAGARQVAGMVSDGRGGAMLGLDGLISVWHPAEK